MPGPGVEVLAVASRAVLGAFEALGLDGDALLAEAGLTRAALEDPDRRIPAVAADGLWAAAATRAGDPELALRAAERLEFGAYRVIDHLAAHAPSLGRALERIATYFALVDPRAQLELDASDPAACRIRFRSAVAGLPIPLPAAEYTFAALLLRTRASLGFDFRPVRVEFAAPAPASQAAHERVFACPITFAAPDHAMWLARADCDRAPARRPDPSLFAVLDQHAALLHAGLPPLDQFLASVADAIRVELDHGDATLARVGKRLGMSGRTLQRRLEEHGARFGALVDEASADRARALLRDPGLGLGEIAFLLGFADQSAFTRAFKRWTGITPGRWRAGGSQA